MRLSPVLAGVIKLWFFMPAMEFKSKAEITCYPLIWKRVLKTKLNDFLIAWMI